MLSHYSVAWPSNRRENCRKPRPDPALSSGLPTTRDAFGTSPATGHQDTWRHRAGVWSAGHTESLKELGLVSLEKAKGRPDSHLEQQSSRAQTRPRQTLLRYAVMGQHTISVCGTRHKLGDGKLLLDVRKRLFTARLTQHWKREVWSLHPWETHRSHLDKRPMSTWTRRG